MSEPRTESEELTLDVMKARYGNPPADLTIDVRVGLLKLKSGEYCVEIDLGGRYGVFRDGPVTWDRLLMANILPALAILQRHVHE